MNRMIIAIATFLTMCGFTAEVSRAQTPTPPTPPAAQPSWVLGALDTFVNAKINDGGTYTGGVMITSDTGPFTAHGKGTAVWPDGP